jgi:hypothetical protein
MSSSVKALVEELGIASNYRIYLATDSPKIIRLFKALDDKVVVRDMDRMPEGEGWIMDSGGKIGGHGPEGTDTKAGTARTTRLSRCWNDSVESMLDMLLLGMSDVLVSTKRSSFTWPSKSMAYARGVPVCEQKQGNGAEVREVGYDCMQFVDGKQEEKKGLAKQPLEGTGL